MWPLHVHYYFVSVYYLYWCVVVWGQFGAQSSVISTCPILKIEYLIRLKNFQLRYVNDILILANDTNEINILHGTFQRNSVLNFIPELNKNN